MILYRKKIDDLYNSILFLQNFYSDQQPDSFHQLRSVMQYRFIRHDGTVITCYQGERIQWCKTIYLLQCNRCKDHRVQAARRCCAVIGTRRRVTFIDPQRADHKGNGLANEYQSSYRSQYQAKDICKIQRIQFYRANQ